VLRAMARSTGPLLVAPDLRGLDYTRAHSDATDRWFRDVFSQALGQPAGLALVAVGGYGRRELCPHSDIDVILIHDDLDNYAEAAEALWYPVWDRGIKMGYAVVTEEQARTLAASELNWATAFLAGRHLAGDEAEFDRFTRLTTEVWAQHGESLMGQLADSIRARHEDFGDVAFHLEPNLKEGRGGLRDVHALDWAEQVRPGFATTTPIGARPAGGGPGQEGEPDGLAADVATLLAARVELHRLSGRAGDMLSLDAQEDVARALGDDSSHDLMVRLALSARRIAWHSDEAWSRWERATGRAVFAPLTAEPIATEFGLVNGHIELTSRVDVPRDPLAVLRLAATAARTKRTIGRASLARLRDDGPELPRPWPAEARRLLADLLLAGRPAISVVEDLDHFELMTRLLPEWEHVRCRPQRNVMHTFTVDRHLCETAANASRLVHRVNRPDLLVVGALLHDIGKGYPGDHTEVGMEVIATMASRMGHPDEEVAILVDLCRHHLLLPDFATRRDLSDPGTISAVAAAVDSVEFLELLAALTEADSIATGPATWGTWKAGLLRDLVKRTTFVLEGGAPTELDDPDFPSEDIMDMMARGENLLRGEGSVLTVVAPDRPALFSHMAGVLAMNGLEVLDAAAYSGDGMATCRFSLQPPATGVVDWEKVMVSAERALDGRLAVTARVRQRAQAYARYQRRLSAAPPRRDVIIDNDISEGATVVEVHAADTVGLLFWITQALAELHLDIRRAKIQTFGAQAVDSFYLCNEDGHKLSDPDVLQELAIAIRSAVGQEGS
jgi:[protein-PII] uridylyltransferase